MIRLGQTVDSNQPLAMIHARNEDQWQQAADAVKAAIVISEEQPEATPEVYRKVRSQDV